MSSPLPFFPLQSCFTLLNSAIAFFAGLFKEGYCRPQEEGEGEGEEGGKLQDDVSGTGMGAGEGAFFSQFFRMPVACTRVCSCLRMRML